MEAIVDIFARLPNGKPKWIESVNGLQEARARVCELNRLVPCDYFIRSEHNGIIEREEYPAVR